MVFFCILVHVNLGLLFLGHGESWYRTSKQKQSCSPYGSQEADKAEKGEGMRETLKRHIPSSLFPLAGLYFKTVYSAWNLSID